MSQRNSTGRGSAPAAPVAAAAASVELPLLFEDDVVRLVDSAAAGGGSASAAAGESFGIVLETAWDSDNEAEEDDDEDEDRLPAGFVRVAWPDRREQALAASALEVVDRSFLHGDVVTRREEPQGQIGTVIDVQLEVDLAFSAVNGGADAVTLKRLNARDVQLPHPYVIGRYVTRGAMLGLVQNVLLEVDVAFGPTPFAPTGVARLQGPEPSVYKPRLESKEEVHEDEVGQGVYYPGLRVKAKHAAWKRAGWVVGKHDAASSSNDEGVVVRVRVLEVHVEWISGDEDIGQEGGDTAILTPEEAVLLGLFEETRMQVGDHMQIDGELLQKERARVVAEHAGDSAAAAAGAIEEKKDDASASAAAAAPSAAPASKAKNKAAKRAALAAPQRDWSHAFAFAGTITRTYTSIRVRWQDGTATTELEPALNFLSRAYLLDNDFSPDDFAVVAPSCRLVSVLAVDARERMVHVRYLPKRLRQFEEGEWWNEAADDDGGEDEEKEDRRAPPAGPSSSPLVFHAAARAPESMDETDTKEDGHTQWVPVMELKANPHFEFCLGGAVVRIPGSRDAEIGDALPPDSRMGHAGQVSSIAGGLVSVVWADRSTSTVEADQLLIVDHEDDDEDDDGEDDDEYEDEDEEEDCACEADCDGEKCGCACHDTERDDAASDALPASGGAPDAAAEEDEAEDEASHDQSAFPAEWTSAGFWKKSATAGGSSEVDAASAALGGMSLGESAVALAASAHPSLPHVPAAAARAAYSYSSFDVIEAAEPDAPVAGAAAAASSAPAAPASSLLHHKFESTPFAPVNPKAFAKRVRRVEWATLSTNLPPGIHVIAFEARMDLLKCLIAGPVDTPVYGSVFQFDIQLPADYPASPPLMHFHSRGSKCNPNLYVDGNVCLSLLGTWKAANVSERWDESNSNLLQLLVSLQGLVIGVPEPYFLEAGYSKQVGRSQAILNSHRYNEDALTVSLSHLTSYVSSPLQAHPFTAVVLEHSLNEEVCTRARELDRVAREWEAKRREKLAAFGAGAAPSASSAAAAAPADNAADAAVLATVLARFGVRITTADAAEPAAAAAAAPSSDAALPAAAPSAPYQPSLGFVVQLAKATQRLVAALDRAQQQNAAAAGAAASASK